MTVSLETLRTDGEGRQMTQAHESGFPPPRMTAPADQRYVGLYYYSAYWRSWDKVLSIEDGVWTVQQVDLSGNAASDVRTHRTPLWANHFADKPFAVLTF